MLSIVCVLGVGFLLGYPALGGLLRRGRAETAERAARLQGWLVQSRVAVGVTAVVAGGGVLVQSLP